MHISQNTGFIQYFDEADYMHFVQILDGKVIASIFPATALNAPNKFVRDGPKHHSVRKRANEEGKRTYQIQSYAISWHFRITISVKL